MAAILVAMAGLVWSSNVGAAPKTVVTIKPIHSLVAAVMAGIGQPRLLVTGAASPHSHALKPSQARALAVAELVVWVGPEMESFFIKPTSSLPATTTVLTLNAEPGVTKLRARRGGAWQSHGADEDHQDAAGEHAEGGHDIDAHSWLDPANGRAIVALVADRLAVLDPANAAAYRANAVRVTRELQALEQEIAGLLAPLRHVPYVVFHDAYQYFEARFRTNAVGSISISPDRPPSARRLLDIRRRIKASGAVCVFAEPQFEPRLVDTAREGTPARAATLDPLGAAIEAGPNAYASLLRNLALALASCLEG